MTFYLMNSAVITEEGLYSYSILSPTHPLFISFLKAGEENKWSDEYISALGYEETAEAIFIITGIKPPVNRIQIKMKPKDEAFVFRLTLRPDPSKKGELSKEFILANCEVGWLRRIE
jgi:hypothetical protein